jgi:hypothetical protein
MPPISGDRRRSPKNMNTYTISSISSVILKNAANQFRSKRRKKWDDESEVLQERRLNAARMDTTL